MLTMCDGHIFMYERDGEKKMILRGGESQSVCVCVCVSVYSFFFQNRLLKKRMEGEKLYICFYYYSALVAKFYFLLSLHSFRVYIIEMAISFWQHHIFDS